MMMKWKCLRENTTKGMVNKCGLFAVLSVVLSIGLSLLFSGVGNAQSAFDDHFEVTEGYSVVLCGVYHTWTAEDIRDLYEMSAARFLSFNGQQAYEDVGLDIVTENLSQNKNFYLYQSYEGTSIRLVAYNEGSQWEFASYNNGSRSYFKGTNVTYLIDSYIHINNQNRASTICENTTLDTDIVDIEDLKQVLAYGWTYENSAGDEILQQITNFYGDYIHNLNVLNSNNPMNLKGYTKKGLIFALNGDLTYPEGFEGETIPNSIGGGTEILATYAPDFQYTYNNLNLWASDHEQDLPVFEPDLQGYHDDGYRVEWTVWECRGGEWYAETASCNGGQTELLKLETLDVNESFTFDVPELGEYRLQAEYRVSQCYRYGSYPETPDHCFSSSPSVEPNLQNYKWERRAVIIDMDGGAGGGDTSEMECGYGGFNCDPNTSDSNMLPCFTRDFPYINVNNCVKNVFSLFDVLTFGRQSIFGFSTNTLECKAIPRVGDWMNLENRYICPQFPGHVRDLVTPFITLTLGMFMVVFISRISRETYN